MVFLCVLAFLRRKVLGQNVTSWADYHPDVAWRHTGIILLWTSIKA